MRPTDPTTVETLLAEHAWVSRIAHTLVRDAHTADDLAQQTLATALRRPPENAASPRAWLATVLRNESRKRLRAESRRARREHAVARRERLTSTAALVERAETHERVVHSVLELEEPYRSTVLLRFFESLPPRAIARRQGVPVETVRTRLKRAIAKLRERFEARLGGDRDEARRALALLAAPPAALGSPLMAVGAWFMALKAKAVLFTTILLLAGSGTLIWTFSDGGTSLAPEAASSPDRDSAPATLKGRGIVASVGGVDAAVSATAVAGRVIDAKGGFVPWVPVELTVRGRDAPFATSSRRSVARAFSWPVTHGAAAKRSTRTDEHGAYRFEDLEDGMVYELRAMPAAPLTGTYSLAVPRAGRTRVVDLVVLPTADIRGRVVDAHGAGVRAWTSARVKPSAVNRTRFGSWDLPDVTTDAEGRFSLEGVPGGELRLSVTAPGRRRFTGLWRTPVGGAIVIQLGGEGAGEITGRVRDRAGRPILGARLLARGSLPMGGKPPYGRTVVGLATSDAAGRYQIEGLPDSPVSLQVVADGFVVAWPLVAAGVNLRQTEPRVVDVTLVRCAALRGVVRSEDGEPIRDAFVFVRRGRGRSVQGSRTDSDGRYRIEDLTPGTAEVWAAAEGYWMPDVDDRVQRDGQGFEEIGLPLTLREAGTTVERDFVLVAGQAVTGRVVDPNGVAVGGAVVRASNGRPPIPNEEQVGSEVISDVQGRFALPGLAPRPDWRISAHKGIASTPADVALDLTSGASDELVLVLTPTFAILGRVLDAKGDAIAKAHVMLDGIRPPTRADAEGRFRFERIPPGRHRVALTDAYGMREAKTSDLVIADDEVSIEIEAPEDYVTTAILLDPTGEPMGGVWVEFQVPFRGSAGHATPDSDGRFTVLGLPPGAIEVIVEAIVLEQTLEAGARDVRLVFERPAATVLRGTVWAPDGSVAARADLLITRGTPPRLDRSHFQLGGQFEVHLGGAPGRVDVAVVGAFDGSGVRLNVLPLMIQDANVSQPLEFRLRPGRLIAGVVVDPTGRGLEGIRVKVTSQGSRDGRAVLTFPEPQTTTDAKGRFMLVGLLDGPVTVATEERIGWMPARPIELESGEEELRFTLEPSGSIAGIVVDPDGRPIPNARVGIRFSRANGSGAMTWSRTDSDGRFATTVPQGVTAEVVARAGPYAFETLPEVAAGTTNLVIRGTRALTIAGEVRGPDGEPATDAYVVVLRVGDPLPGERKTVASATLTGGDPRFRAGPLAPGSYRVIARAGSGPYIDSEPQIISAPAKGVVLTLGRGRVFTGRVLGQDLDGFKVTWLASVSSGLRWRRVTQVGPGGAFTLDTLPSENGVIIVHRDGDDRCARIDDLRSDRNVDPIQLVKGLTIRGRVDQTGSPTRVNRPQVWARLGGKIVAIANADADGAFVIRGLPVGRYRVGWGAPGSLVVEAPAGAADVVLRPAR